jgi:hypothetical protein
MKLTENGQEFVNNYKNIFQTFELPAISIVKYRLNDLINVKRYNAVVSRTTNNFNHVYVDKLSAVETINVDKQPISDHSLVNVTSSGKKKRTKFSEIEYQS